MEGRQALVIHAQQPQHRGVEVVHVHAAGNGPVIPLPSAPMPHSSDSVRFGAFELDRRSGELRKGRTRLKVSPQSIEVLKALVERPGDLVTRDELKDRLWPADTFVDFEHGLNTAVRRLRAALGDSAHTPRLIETLPRRGYRFIGRIDPAQDERPPGAAVSVASETAPRDLLAGKDSEIASAETRAHALAGGSAREPFRSHWRALALVGSISIVCAAVIVAWRPGRDEPRIAELPFTVLEGDELSGRFSPDGQDVVFSWTPPGGRADIYLRSVHSDMVRPFVVTDDADEVGPVFSPDGRSIAFLRLGAVDAAIVVQPRDGGPEGRVTRIRNPHYSFIASPGPYLAWTSDSGGLIYHDGGLRLWRLNGERTIDLTRPPPTAALGDQDPALCPEGKSLVFVRVASAGSADLYRLRLTDQFEPKGQPELLFSNGGWNRSPAWHPDGRRIIFTSGHWGRQRLWYLDVGKPSAARPVAGIGADAHQPAISPVGDLLYTRWFFRRQLWALPLAAAGEARSAPEPLVISTRADNTPRIGRDGSHVVFQSDRSGSFEIWVAKVDGSDLRRVTSFDGPPAGSPDLSPDSAHVVFDRIVDGQRDVFVSDLRGTNLRRLTDDPADDVVPRWSADGRSVYFASYREGASQIWKVAIDTGRAIRMTRDGGLVAEESPDGRTLYFTRDDKAATAGSRRLAGRSRAQREPLGAANSQLTTARRKTHNSRLTTTA
jgi:Tol biopolymer transport system component/DNA-binding winged helix-turn-helix (wHTH) protein